MTDAVHAYAFAEAIREHFKQRDLTEAFRVIVKAYYDEYTDAEELDCESRAALEAVFDWCFYDGENSNDEDFETVIKKPGGKSYV